MCCSPLGHKLFYIYRWPTELKELSAVIYQNRPFSLSLFEVVGCVRHDWATELNWLKKHITYYICVIYITLYAINNYNIFIYILTYYNYNILYIYVYFKLVYDTLGFPGDSDGKESACNMGIPSLIPGLGRSPGEGNGYPLQYSCLENSMDRRAWWATVYGVAKTWLVVWEVVRYDRTKGEIKSKIQIPGQRIYNIIKKIKEIFIKAPVQWETVWVCYGLPLLWTEFERK